MLTPEMTLFYQSLYIFNLFNLPNIAGLAAIQSQVALWKSSLCYSSTQSWCIV